MTASTDDAGVTDALFAELRAVVVAANGNRIAASEIVQETRMKDLGIDSLKFIMLMLDIEERLQRRVFTADNVGAVQTVGDLVELVARNARTTAGGKAAT